MRNLFFAFLNSIYNLDFLKAQRFSPKAAWKYFSVFILFFTFIFYLPGIFKFGGEISEVKRTVEALPDFEAEFKDDRLTVTKLKQPFHHKVNENFSIVIDSTGINADPVGNFITSTSVSYLFFAGDKMEFYDAESGAKTTRSWSSLPGTAFDRSMLVNGLQKAAEFPYSIIVLLVFILTAYVVIFISKLYTIFVVSLVVYLSARIRGMEWKWMEVFTVALFATTLPSLIEIGLSLTPLRISYIHFIALLAFMLAIVYTKDVESKDITE